MTFDLPELHQSDLDSDALWRLFDEWARFASVIEVRAKGGPAMSSSALDLEGARSGLGSGSLRGVQVVYTWESETWVDTVLARPGGFRVTRMRAVPR